MGEALVSVLDAKGTPTIVQRAGILPPHSSMNAVEAFVIQNNIDRNPLRSKYLKAVDNESAYELLTAEAEEAQREAEEEAQRKAEEAQREKEEKEREKEEKQRSKGHNKPYNTQLIAHKSIIHINNISNIPRRQIKRNPFVMIIYRTRRTILIFYTFFQ